MSSAYNDGYEALASTMRSHLASRKSWCVITDSDSGRVVLAPLILAMKLADPYGVCMTLPVLMHEETRNLSIAFFSKRRIPRKMLRRFCMAIGMKNLIPSGPQDTIIVANNPEQCVAFLDSARTGKYALIDPSQN